MPREHPALRDTIWMLNERFPDHDMLNAKEAMIVWGCKSVNTIKKYVPFNEQGKVNKVILAHKMCEIKGG